MILTIDIGNSNIVLGGVRDDEIVFDTAQHNIRITDING